MARKLFLSSIGLFGLMVLFSVFGSTPAQAQFVVGGGNHSAPAGTSAGAGWQTALDCDFSTQVNQTLSTNGDYTICGVTWTKGNSASDASAAAVVNGTGLTFTPASSTDFTGSTFTLPYIKTRLSSLISGFSLDTPLRVWIYTSNVDSDFPADFDGVSLAVGNFSTLSYYTIKHGHTSTVGWYCSYNYNGTRLNYQAPTLSNLNVGVITQPGGVATIQPRALVGTYSAGFPAAGALQSVSGEYLGGDSVVTTALGLGTDQYLLLGAARAGSGTSLTGKIVRVKVEYRN